MFQQSLKAIKVLFHYKTVFTIFTAFVLIITTLLLNLLPDIFQAKDFLVYQVWSIGVWIFVVLLPKGSENILDINSWEAAMNESIDDQEEVEDDSGEEEGSGEEDDSGKKAATPKKKNSKSSWL